MTLVDEIGFEREPRKLGAANADVTLGFLLEFPNAFDVEIPFETRVGRRRARQRS